LIPLRVVCPSKNWGEAAISAPVAGTMPSKPLLADALPSEQPSNASAIVRGTVMVGIFITSNGGWEGGAGKNTSSSEIEAQMLRWPEDACDVGCMNRLYENRNAGSRVCFRNLAAAGFE
jgi:hypothetical protein